MFGGLLQIGHVGAGDQDSSEEVRVNLTVLNKNVFALVMVFTCYSGQLHHVSGQQDRTRA